MEHKSSPLPSESELRSHNSSSIPSKSLEQQTSKFTTSPQVRIKALRRSISLSSNDKKRQTDFRVEDPHRNNCTNKEDFRIQPILTETESPAFIRPLTSQTELEEGKSESEKREHQFSKHSQESPHRAHCSVPNAKRIAQADPSLEEIQTVYKKELQKIQDCQKRSLKKCLGQQAKNRNQDHPISTHSISILKSKAGKKAHFQNDKLKNHDVKKLNNTQKNSPNLKTKYPRNKKERGKYHPNHIPIGNKSTSYFKSAQESCTNGQSKGEMTKKLRRNRGRGFLTQRNAQITTEKAKLSSSISDIQNWSNGISFSREMTEKTIMTEDKRLSTPKTYQRKGLTEKYTFENPGEMIQIMSPKKKKHTKSYDFSDKNADLKQGKGKLKQFSPKFKIDKTAELYKRYRHKKCSPSKSKVHELCQKNSKTSKKWGNEESQYTQFEYRVKAKKEAILKKIKMKELYSRNRDLTFNQGKKQARKNLKKLAKSHKNAHDLSVRVSVATHNSKRSNSSKNASESRFYKYCKGIEKLQRRTQALNRQTEANILSSYFNFESFSEERNKLGDFFESALKRKHHQKQQKLGDSMGERSFQQTPKRNHFYSLSFQKQSDKKDGVQLMEQPRTSRQYRQKQFSPSYMVTDLREIWGPNE